MSTERVYDKFPIIFLPLKGGSPMRKLRVLAEGVHLLFGKNPSVLRTSPLSGEKISPSLKFVVPPHRTQCHVTFMRTQTSLPAAGWVITKRGGMLIVS